MLNHCNFAFLKSCPFCPTLFLADRAANFLEEKETWIIPFLSFLFFLSLSFLRSLFPLPLHFFFFYAHSAKPIYRQIRENVFSLVPVKLARLIKKEGKNNRYFYSNSLLRDIDLILILLGIFLLSLKKKKDKIRILFLGRNSKEGDSEGT